MFSSDTARAGGHQKETKRGIKGLPGVNGNKKKLCLCPLSCRNKFAEADGGGLLWSVVTSDHHHHQNTNKAYN